MKKIRYGCLTLLCVLMMVSISACGGRDNGTGTTSSPSQSAATASGGRMSQQASLTVYWMT